MYLQYFGLYENPFSIPPDPRYLYLSRGHQEALAHLQYGLGESGGFVQLTGEVGTGKTLLIRALGERLPKDVDVALVLYPVLTVTEFVVAICDELRVPHPGEQASLKQLIDALNAHLLQSHARGRRTMLIIDEAQNLSREVLEQIRLLTNLETTKQKLLQIILIGQPELVGLLAQPDLRQLAQRITARYRLTALTREETCYYIGHRCRVAGGRALLFNMSAMRRVHALSGGIPRLINIICDRSLLGAYTREKTVVDTGIVNRAATEIGSSARSSRWLTWRVLTPAIVMLTAFLLAAGWQWWPGWKNPLPPEDKAAVADASDTAPAGNVAVDNSVAVTAPEPKGVTTAVEVSAASPSKPAATLEPLLTNPEQATDTESAMKNLFERWSLNYASLVGGTGCERALNAGLHCVYKTGTWNNLRSYNRPAVIELQDTAGGKHHVLVAELTADTVSLVIGGQPHEFPVSEVGHYWFGKYLLLWKPPMPEQEMLRLGDRGDAVIWLRDALARYRGEPLAAESSEIFDKELQAQLREFQGRHRLVPDGVAGRVTLAQLQNYLPGKSPALVADAGTAETR
jgi:general secretion pathway protein A